jgi:hypothetical protein
MYLIRYRGETGFPTIWQDCRLKIFRRPDSCPCLLLLACIFTLTVCSGLWYLVVASRSNQNIISLVWK